MKKFLIILTFLLGLGSFAQPASASSDDDIVMTIYPATQTIELNPGQEYSGTVKLANNGKKPFTAKMSAMPFQVDSETYDPDFSTENIYTRLSSWITFAEESYYLEPDTSVDVSYTVHVPEDVVGGGQYAAIMARTEDSKQEGSSLQVISQVASILYGRINGAEINPSGEVVEQLIPGFIIDGDLQISETTYNTGNVDFKVYHAVTITNLLTGEEIINPDTRDSSSANIGSSSTVILPGTSRQNVITWENSPRLGVYRVRQTIRFLDSEVNEERIVIFCPSWLLISLLVLLALAILWIILAARHRRRQKPQVF